MGVLSRSLSLGVNVGFMGGALLSSALGLADRRAPQHLIAAGTLCAALFNAGLLLPGCGFGLAVMLRVGSGAAMSIVPAPSNIIMCTVVMYVEFVCEYPCILYT